jgi:hypothetical protein
MASWPLPWEFAKRVYDARLMRRAQAEVLFLVRRPLCIANHQARIAMPSLRVGKRNQSKQLKEPLDNLSQMA